MRKNKYMNKIVENLKETGRNKLYAIALIMIGVFAIKMTGDGTFLALFGTIALVLFFSKENWIV